MSWGKHVLVLILAIVHCSHISAQTEPNLSSKVTQLLEVINEQHIQPEKIDDAFIDHAHHLFLDVLDGDRLFFSSEDLVQMESYAEPLVGAIRMNAQSYLDSIYSIWTKGIDRAESLSNQFFKKPFDLNMISDSSLFSKAVPQGKLEAKWMGLLRSQVYSEAVSLLEVENFEATKLNVYVDSAFEMVKLRMKDYFKNIRLEQSDLE